MGENPKKLHTWNIKKCERFANKKRKLEALLNLFKEDETIVPVKKKKASEETLSETCKQLRNQLKGFSKKSDEPEFHLEQLGYNAEISLKNYDADKKIEPIYIEHVYQLLLKSAIGHMSPFPLNWAGLQNPQNVVKTVILVVEGLSFTDFLSNVSKLNNIHQVFSRAVQVVSSNVPFALELSSLHHVTDFHIRSKDTFSTTFPGQKNVRIEASTPTYKLSKLHLLLSPIQMAMENYPLPKSVFAQSNSENYAFSQKNYSHVRADSPLFAIDCEMCQTTASPSELTRVALVNENMETIYHTFVKPDNAIVNYMTRYSGITKEMLEDVTVTLSDVQTQLREVLPSNAILCGQSLNCDLHALKMIHPYVIDTSIIFNRSGIRAKKESLKNLTKFYLKEVIQDGKKGHNPIEDAIATMKLVQLKLQNGVRFGDACFEHLPSNSNEKANPTEVAQNSGAATTKSVQQPAKKQNEGFFARLSKYRKKGCLVGSEDSLNHYDQTLLEDTEKVLKPVNKKIVKAVAKRIEKFDFVVGHLRFDERSISDSLEDFDNSVKKLYEACPGKTLFTMLVSGVDESQFEDIKNGIFMVTLKKA